jgi:hypothetical protein
VQAVAFVPLCSTACGFGTTPVTERARQVALSANGALCGWRHPLDFTPGVLSFALRVSLRLFKIAAAGFVVTLDLISRLAALVPKPRVNLTTKHSN